jgi:hypothetical protein
MPMRWAQGPVMIKTLWQELQVQGFSGCYKSVWNDVAQLTTSTRSQTVPFLIFTRRKVDKPPTCFEGNKLSPRHSTSETFHEA